MDVMNLLAHALAADDFWLEHARDRIRRLRIAIEDLESSGEDERTLATLRALLERYERSSERPRVLDPAA